MISVFFCIGINKIGWCSIFKITGTHSAYNIRLCLIRCHDNYLPIPVILNALKTV